jgi:uncharacterized membrane protein
MKTVIYLAFTFFISIGAFFAAMNMEHYKLFPFCIAFGIWVLFFWGLNKRWKKAEERKLRERMFAEYMRKNGKRKS